MEKCREHESLEAGPWGGQKAQNKIKNDRTQVPTYSGQTIDAANATCGKAVRCGGRPTTRTTAMGCGMPAAGLALGAFADMREADSTTITQVVSRKPLMQPTTAG